MSEEVMDEFLIATPAPAVLEFDYEAEQLMSEVEPAYDEVQDLEEHRESESELPAKIASIAFVRRCENTWLGPTRRSFDKCRCLIMGIDAHSDMMVIVEHLEAYRQQKFHVVSQMRFVSFSRISTRSYALTMEVNLFRPVSQSHRSIAPMPLRL